MEDIAIKTLLTNSGLNVISIDRNFIYFEDPTCIFPAFDAFLHYAWIIIVILTGIMLFGWAVLYIIKGAKLDSIFHNAKSLILIFTVLSLTKPIVNLVYGDNLFARQCDQKQISRTEIDALLNQRKQNLGKIDEYLLYESFDVIDSGVGFNTENNTLIDYNSDTKQNDTRTMLSEFPASEIVRVQFQSDDNSTIYITKTGIKIKRGNTKSAAWKNNNPGNIRATSSLYELGAIGSSNGWAVFASEQDGINAMKKLLMSKHYNHLTLDGAINKWAPVTDNNNPERYTRYVSKSANVPPDKFMKDVTNYELEKIVRAMQTFEGWEPGSEQKL